MATQKLREDPRTTDRKVERQRTAARNRRIAAFGAMVVLVAVAVAAFALTRGDSGQATSGGVSSGSASSVVPPILGSAGSMVDLTTHQVTPLPSSIRNAGAAFYAVSPDHTKIAFGTCCSGLDPLYVANVDGTGIRKLTSEGMDAYGAQWSPDGSTLVYQQRDGTTLKLGNLFLVDVATGEQTQLTSFDQSRGWGWWFAYPSFAPDGRSVLYHLPRGGVGRENATWDIWTVSVNGGKASLAARDVGWGDLAEGAAPASRDFAYLAPMDVSDLSGGGLWLRSWGSRSVKPREVVQGGGQLSWPRWSPDGTRISYADGGSIYVLNVSTGETTEVALGSNAEWFDDDTLVIS